MPGFRLRRLGLRADAAPFPLEEARRVIADVVRPGHFFVAPSVELTWEHAEREEVPWELFRGRLLDRAQTRQQRTFEAWNIYLIEAGQRSGEPLLSVKLDPATRQVYVVRAVHCYAWEGYDAGNNTFLSREVPKWVRELVGEVDCDRFADAAALHDELICLLFHAMVGTSRLPLNSLEAPLPLFSFGQLAYCHRPDLPEGAPPLATVPALIECGLHAGLSELERVKLLETLLRAGAEEQAAGLSDLLIRLFDEVALSPDTGFIRQAVPLLGLDPLGDLIRRLVRHLTAYDLITFHHQGANYPDALLLDAALKRFIELIEQGADEPVDESRQRLRRRALRQGWLLHRFYEGLPVPDAPTSPGENARVLPPPHVRVPEEQIVQPEKRTKRLFADDPLPRYLGARGQAVLRQSLLDLHHPAELCELGTALFLDRPLGLAKPPTEPDRTPLVSYEAFSRILAGKRLRYLADDLGLLTAAERDQLLAQLKALPVPGVPLPLMRGVARPGAVSLDDARKAAADFVFLRTTARSRRELAELFDFTAVEQEVGPWALLMRDDNPERLALYDGAGRKLAELRVRAEQGYVSRAGVEFPVGGLEARAGGKTLPVPVREG